MVPNAKLAFADAGLALKAPAQPAASGSRSPSDSVVHEGWLLKKRRKKLQGYARRYFFLYASGLLSYAFEPESDLRDQIFLQTAAISSSPGRRDIHVDSGTVTFHIKCLTREDFDSWMGALRKFITPGGGNAERATLRHSQSISPLMASVHRAVGLLEEMEKTIHELAFNYNELDEDDRRSATSSDRSKQANGKPNNKETHSILSIFRKPTMPSPATTPQQRHSFNKEAILKSSPQVQSSEVVLAALLKLREQHGTLSELIHNLATMNFVSAPAMQRGLADEGSTSTLGHGTIRSPMSPRVRSALQRASMSSVTDSIWYDAEEYGAEEYVMNDEPEEETVVMTRGSSTLTGDTNLNTERSDSDEDVDIAAVDDTPDEKLELPVNRRTRLPARPSGDEGSLFAILKKNVGQDLSNISFPVTFNEPLTILQRVAEEMEYHDLIEKAVQSSDWVERICYVAAFAVSGYASTKFRSGRKGFTPLLGETYEDARTHFIAEKVVHKPLLVAFHAEGSDWELTGTAAGKTKFWGKSFEVIPTGITRLRIGNETFEWTKPSSFTRNLVMGAKYLEHCGEMIIKNTATGATCVLDFKETGYWASTPNVVSGTVTSADGRVCSHLEGKWDEQISQKLGSNHLKVLWRISSFPRDASEYYGYTYFAITLNELNEDLKKKLPPTDSRFRPDVRALEEGNIDLSEDEKVRVEQMQRDRRERGLDVKPRWFKHIDNDNWVYVGGYWEARRSGWKNCDIKSLW